MKSLPGSFYQGNVRGNHEGEMSAYLIYEYRRKILKIKGIRPSIVFLTHGWVFVEQENNVLHEDRQSTLTRVPDLLDADKCDGEQLNREHRWRERFGGSAVLGNQFGSVSNGPSWASNNWERDTASSGAEEGAGEAIPGRWKSQVKPYGTRQ